MAQHQVNDDAARFGARRVPNSLGFGYAPRAIFACHPKDSRGRVIVEPESPTRTAFQRDRDRIIHSTAFRRLKHKTQVFISNEGDHYRTRLTHSIEVGQIARGIARALHLDEDLTEAIALVHDFGHTPFGHAGERALDAKLKQTGLQGFDHNAQSLRIVTELEQCYASFDGLNLTWETLEGLVKHNGPIALNNRNQFIAGFDAKFSLDLSSYASMEAQCAAIADDIAYNAHDIDDGLRSGLLTIEQIKDAPIAGALLAEVQELYPDLQGSRLSYEIVRRQITIMVEDVIAHAQAKLGKINPQSADDVRRAGVPFVAFGTALKNQELGLKAFLTKTLYRNQEVMRKMHDAAQIVDDLFDIFTQKPQNLPSEWRERYDVSNGDAKLVVISDFIAGMTDQYAVQTHEALFDQTPKLV